MSRVAPTPSRTRLYVAACGALLLIASFAFSVAAGGDPEPVQVLLCDGETKATIPAGQVPDEEVGRRVSAKLMAEWLKKHPDAKWEMAERSRHDIVPAADNLDLIDPDAEAQGGTYARITERDVLLWKRETERMVVRGSEVFHSADELGSTIAVSCDMCHPDGANTHPETYPKYQVQLGRAVLLRDMINWCVEHPVRAPKLDPDGEKMRALEAYILAQRKGVPLNYGRR